jgi:hypothetical protein
MLEALNLAIILSQAFATRYERFQLFPTAHAVSVQHSCDMHDPTSGRSFSPMALPIELSAASLNMYLYSVMLNPREAEAQRAFIDGLWARGLTAWLREPDSRDVTVTRTDAIWLSEAPRFERDPKNVQKVGLLASCSI